MAKGASSRRADGGPAPAAERPAACVGIAASAAGGHALRQLVADLPGDTGAAFLVTVGPEQGADLASLLEPLDQAAKMPVLKAAHGEAVRPDHVYLADPAEVVVIEGARLKTSKAAPADGRVDSLLTSVAEGFEEAAVVVVLAGLGADGAAGAAAAKRCGGFAIAEGTDEPLEPEGQATTAAGSADMRLPVERIAAEIVAYLENVKRAGDGAALAEAPKADTGRQVARIASILRDAAGNDFHGYKHATFLRRIQRRMQVVQLDDMERYIERLRNDPAEAQHLFQDLLIGVTQFFRDPAGFEVLERAVIPRMFEGRGADDHIRVWAPGCATGEEAYSIAILLREQMARMDAAPQVQIFATDIDARALAVARSGRYADSISRHVPAERLARWFVKEGAAYRVVRQLREMCVFSAHNLVEDAPFSRIDLVSCRNLLIYLNGELQDRVIRTFHFSLKPGGFVFLGPAENVTRRPKLFSPIDRKRRIFRRLETPTPALPDFPPRPRGDRPDAHGEAASHRPPAHPPLAGRTGRRVEQIAERYAPAYVVVDENHDVLHFCGRTERFLEPAEGAASLGLLNLVHRDLRLDLRTALHKAVSQGAKVEARNVRMAVDGFAWLVDIVVEPIGADDEGGALVILFRDAGPAVEDGHAGDHGHAADEHAERLETDLRITKERLETTIEELESANEELRSSNDEYESINEALQAANDELETVNGELVHRVGDLARANSDLKNLFESTRIATLLVDNDLRLRSFTPGSSDVFHLMETDVGLPVAHIALRVDYPELQEDARRVLAALGQVEREVEGLDEERRTLVRVLPYRGVGNVIAGVVVTFLDVTGAARAEAALRAAERRFAKAQQMAEVGIWEWNLDTDERWWSPVAYGLWGVSPDEPLDDKALPIHPDDHKQMAADAEAARASGELNHEWRVVRADGSLRWLAAIGRLESASGGRRMLGVIQDVTDRKQTEMRLKMLLGELQHRVRNILGVVRSIVEHTVRSSSTLDELSAHLNGRLDTLARTQGVFTRSGDAALDLEDLIRQELLAVAAREEQIALGGPTLLLRREAAETMALAVHELTTNAVKYGALSEPNGRLNVAWRVTNANGGQRLSLEWREAGVRALDSQPHRNGFGRELIERRLPYELGASTTLEFAPGGVRAVIEVPLTDKIAALDGPAAPEVAE